MLPKDRVLISKLRKRIGLLSIIIFVLVYWLIQKYDDIEFISTDNEILTHELIEKESEIDSLKRTIDRMTKKEPKKEINKKIKKQQPKQIIDTIKEKDTVEIETSVTTDTIN